MWVPFVTSFRRLMCFLVCVSFISRLLIPSVHNIAINWKFLIQISSHPGKQHQIFAGRNFKIIGRINERLIFPLNFLVFKLFAHIFFNRPMKNMCKKLNESYYFLNSKISWFSANGGNVYQEFNMRLFYYQLVFVINIDWSFLCL